MGMLYENQFRSISDLPDGWDGEGSRKFSEAPLRRARFVLDAIALRLPKEKAERLQIFPIVNDGFEIHIHGIYLFLMFDKRNIVSVIRHGAKLSFSTDEAGILDAIDAFLSAVNMDL